MIGSIAAILTTFAFLPQVFKVIKTKGTESIALGMYLMQVAGIALWHCHGIRIGDLPLMMANGVSLILSAPSGRGLLPAGKAGFQAYPNKDPRANRASLSRCRDGLHHPAPDF